MGIMAKIYYKFNVSKETREKYEMVKELYLRRNPQLKNVYLSQDKILSESFDFVLKN